MEEPINMQPSMTTLQQPLPGVFALLKESWPIVRSRWVALLLFELVSFAPIIVAFIIGAFSVVSFVINKGNPRAAIAVAAGPVVILVLLAIVLRLLGWVGQLYVAGQS